MNVEVNGQTLTIVTYHYVRDLARSRYPDIKGQTTDGFSEQLDYMERHYNFVTIADCLAAIEGDSLPAASALLTFDDGYTDHFTNVFPQLSRRGIQGSFYIPAQTVKDHKVLEVNKIHFILACVPDVQRLIDRIEAMVGELREEHSLEDIEEYKKCHAVASRWDPPEVKYVKNMLQKGLPQAVRTQLVDLLFQEHVSADEASFSAELYMDEEQIGCMRSFGMHIGSHSYDHQHLDQMTVEEQHNDIRKSAEFLRALGVPSDEWTFCYPHGKYNDTLVGVLEEHGFLLAFSLRVALARLSQSNRLQLERIDTNDLPVDGSAAINDWTRTAQDAG